MTTTPNTILQFFGIIYLGLLCIGAFAFTGAVLGTWAAWLVRLIRRLLP